MLLPNGYRKEYQPTKKKMMYQPKDMRKSEFTGPWRIYENCVSKRKLPVPEHVSLIEANVIHLLNEKNTPQISTEH